MLIKIILLFLTSCSLALQEKENELLNSNNNNYLEAFGMILKSSSSEINHQASKHLVAIKGCNDILNENDFTCTNCEIKNIYWHGLEQYVEIFTPYSGEQASLSLNLPNSCNQSANLSLSYQLDSNAFDLSFEPFNGGYQEYEVQNRTFSSLNNNVHFKINLKFRTTPHEETALKVELGLCNGSILDTSLYTVFYDLFAYVTTSDFDSYYFKYPEVIVDSDFNPNNYIEGNPYKFFWDQRTDTFSFVFNKKALAKTKGYIFNDGTNNSIAISKGESAAREICFKFTYLENNQDIYSEDLVLPKVVNVVGVDGINFKNLPNTFNNDNGFISELMNVTDESKFPYSNEYDEDEPDYPIYEDVLSQIKYNEWSFTKPLSGIYDTDLSLTEIISNDTEIFNGLSNYYGNFFNILPFINRSLNDLCFNDFNVGYYNTVQGSQTQYEFRIFRQRMMYEYLIGLGIDTTFLSLYGSPGVGAGAGELLCSMQSYIAPLADPFNKDSWAKMQVGFTTYNLADVTGLITNNNENPIIHIHSGLQFDAVNLRLKNRIRLEGYLQEFEEKQNIQDAISYKIKNSLHPLFALFHEANFYDSMSNYQENLLKTAKKELIENENFQNTNYFLPIRTFAKSYQFTENDSFCNVFKSQEPILDSCLPLNFKIFDTQYIVNNSTNIDFLPGSILDPSHNFLNPMNENIKYSYLSFKHHDFKNLTLLDPQNEFIKESFYQQEGYSFMGFLKNALEEETPTKKTLTFQVEEKMPQVISLQSFTFLPISILKHESNFLLSKSHVFPIKNPNPFLNPQPFGGLPLRIPISHYSLLYLHYAY